MGDRLRERVSSAAPDDRIPVFVALERLASDAADELRASAVEARLQDEGCQVGERAEIVSGLFAECSAGAIARIARTFAVKGMYLDAPSPVVPLGPGYVVPYTQANTSAWTLNPPAKGADQRIGYIEAIAGGTETYDEHFFFANGVNHTRPSNSCSFAAQCGCTGTAGCACKNGRCVGRHATYVGGVMAQIAPAADLYMANVPGMNPVTLNGIKDAYRDLLEANVTIVNQSFLAEFPGPQGHFENEFARSEGIFVTQGAANNAGQENNFGACEYNHNALCVGSHGFGFQPACFSNWVNPEADRDREEPDLLAFGGDGGPTEACSGTPAQPPELAGTNNWLHIVTSTTGTSFAAPAAAASAAVLREVCARSSIDLSALSLRAILMASAIRNSVDFRYSTVSGDQPGGATDWRDGAGILSLDPALEFCQSTGGPARTFKGEVVIDPEDGEPSPPIDDGFETPSEPPQEPTAQDVPLSPDDGRLTQVLLDLGPLDLSARVRGVISWNICNHGSGEAPGGGAYSSLYRATPDFDLFLYNTTKRHVYFASQSFSDNNEGFDVDLGAYPGNEDGDEWVVILGWLPSESGVFCPDSPEGETVGYGFWVEP